MPEKLSSDLTKIFIKDKKSLSLRIHPEGEGQEAARRSMVLLLYGLKMLLNQEDVGVTVIADALRTSGVKFYRLGEMADPLYDEGLINRTGKSKGVMYNITNKGIAQAEAIIEELRPRF